MTYDEKIAQMVAQGLDADTMFDIVQKHLANIQGKEQDIEDFNDYDIPVKPEVEIDGTSTLEKAAQASVAEAKEHKEAKAQRKEKGSTGKEYDFARDPKLNSPEIYGRISELTIGEYNTLKQMAKNRLIAKGFSLGNVDSDEDLFDTYGDLVGDEELDALIDAAIYRVNPRLDPSLISKRGNELEKINIQETLTPYKRKSTGEIRFKPKSPIDISRIMRQSPDLVLKNIKKEPIKAAKAIDKAISKDPAAFVSNDEESIRRIDNAQMNKLGRTVGSEHTTAPWATRWHNFDTDPIPGLDNALADADLPVIPFEETGRGNALAQALFRDEAAGHTDDIPYPSKDSIGYERERNSRMQLARQLGPLLQAAQRRF